MIDSLYIAWKYIRFNRVKTVTLVACITLITFLPVALELLLNESEKQLMSRAERLSAMQATSVAVLTLLKVRYFQAR